MKSFRIRILAFAAAALWLGWAAGASADPAGAVQVLRAIPFASESGAPQKVKDECALDTKVPSFLAEYNSSVQLVDGALGESGRVLTLEITQVHAPGGGAFSGPKSMTVKGTLRENGQEVGNFTASRYSGGGAFGGYKGTCGIVGRCAKAIAKDISEWLSKPGVNSSLGDA